MLPWKLLKPQISPVNQNLSSVYVSLAKFQLVSCNLSLAVVWQMTYTHKLPKLCSATITGYSTNTILILVNLFIFATLFLVIVLCAERFIAIHYCFRYQELVTHKRVVAVVVSIWVLSGLFSLVRLWIPTSIMHVVFGKTKESFKTIHLEIINDMKKRQQQQETITNVKSCYVNLTIQNDIIE